MTFPTKKLLLTSLMVAALAITAHAATSPTPKPGSFGPQPTKPPASLGGLVGDTCTLDSGFSSIFYENADWTDASSARFLPELDQHWNTSSPAKGINADPRWSAKFEAGFTIVGIPPGTPPPANATIDVYPTYQGYVKIFIDGAVVYEGTNDNAPAEYNPDVRSQPLSSSIPHIITVLYNDFDNSQAELELRAVVCDADNPTNCGTKDYFFRHTIAPRADELYYTKKPADTSGTIGTSVNFSMDYANNSTAVPTIQWQRQRTGGNAENIGSNSKSLSYGPLVSEDNGALVHAQMSNGICQLMDDISYANVTVTNGTPTPTPTGSVTPTPGTLSCTPVNQTVAVNEDAVLYASGPVTPYQWTAQNGTPGLGSTNDSTTPFKTKFARPSNDELVVVRTGLSAQATCHVKVIDATPTPTPSSTPLPGSFYCSPATQTVEVGQPASFTAEGGDPGSYAWGTNGYGSPSTGTGKTFTTTFNTPSTRGREVGLSSDGFSSVFCRVNVTVPPTPTPNPNGKQGINGMYVYDHSPVDPLDCSKTPSKYKTPDFPLECDPHIAEDFVSVPISVGAQGLTYHLPGNPNNSFTVVPHDPDLTVQDSDLSADQADLSQYDSIFSGGVQDISKITQAAQIDTFYRVMTLLKEFANNIWPLGSVSGSEFEPAGFYDFTLPGEAIIGDEVAEALSNCLARTDGFGLSTYCPLDNAVLVHEFYHYIQYQLDEDLTTSEDDEIRAIKEGISDYFAIRNIDQQELGNYFWTKEGAPVFIRQILELDTPPYGPDGYGAEHRFFDGLPILTVKGEGYADYHLYGAKIANILISARNHIPDEKNKLLFDRGVILAYRSLGSLYSDQVFSLSSVQLFYIELYRQLNAMVTFWGFPQGDVDYFKDLLYNKAKIGTAIGNIHILIQEESFKETDVCEDDGTGIKYKIGIFKFPAMNAIGDTIKEASVIFSNQSDSRIFTYNATSYPPLVQEGEHSPIVDFTVPILLNFGDGDFKVTFTSVANNNPLVHEEPVPGVITITDSVCK